MNDDIFQSIPQGGDRTKDSENSRITAIANKLEGLCAVYEAQLRDGSQHVKKSSPKDGRFILIRNDMTGLLNIAKVWVDYTHVYAETTDGLRASYAFSDWERLAHATDAQRRDFYLSYGGIHWPQIDEDLSFERMFEDNGLDFAAEPEAAYNA